MNRFPLDVDLLQFEEFMKKNTDKFGFDLQDFYEKKLYAIYSPSRVTVNRIERKRGSSGKKKNRGSSKIETFLTADFNQKPNRSARMSLNTGAWNQKYCLNKFRMCQGVFGLCPIMLKFKELPIETPEDISTGVQAFK